MRSDLDLAAKTECMEAIRLTEGKSSRLQRFVKSGGVTKIARASGNFWYLEANSEAKALH